MLRWTHIARFASEHSPEKEQRLLAFGKSSWNLPQSSESDSGRNDSGEENNNPVSKHIEKIQKNTREKLAFLNDLAALELEYYDGEEKETVLKTFFNDHTEFLGKYFKENLNQEFGAEHQAETTVDSLQSIFSKELKEISKRSLESFGPAFEATLGDRKYTKKYMGMTLGVKFKEDDEMSPEELREFEKQLKEFREKNYVPSAFIFKDKIYMNLDHVDLDYDNKLKALREKRPNITEEQVLEIVERNRERAIIHEIGHYCLDRKDRDGSRLTQLQAHLKNGLGVTKLKENTEWQALENAINLKFDGKFGEQSEEKYIHEAMAICTAARRRPAAKDDTERLVLQAFDALVQKASGNTRVQEILDAFEKDVSMQLDGDGTRESSFQSAKKQVNATTKEKAENLLFQKKMQEKNAEKVFTNAPEEDGITDQIGDEVDQAAKKTETPEQIIKKIKGVTDAIKSIEESRDAFLAPLDGKDREEEELAYDNLLQKFLQDAADLGSMEQVLGTLQKWEKPHTLTAKEKNDFAERYKFADLGVYDDKMNESSVMELDAKNKEKRADLVRELAGHVAALTEPIETVQTLMEKQLLQSEDDASKSELAESEGGVMDWFKRTFSSQNGVTWMSWYDVVKIYNIYKDAILEKYQSSQKIRTYDFAKQANFWKPLQPDLDKQAKSANDEETEKFKEYLKKDGFTYDQLFVDPNVMEQNRSNINRAKAVIDYAADHAWLYKLDRFNGHNVYGLDYEGLWGVRTFEELVEHNSAQQDKESEAGYSKVNNHPEISYIIEDMNEALERKNLWQVHGMMKRLQEKAKLAESNTWAVTTLFRALRNHPDVLEIIDIGMLDKIGGIGIGQSAWTMTLFKSQRKQILRMKNAVRRAKKEDKHKVVAEQTESEDFIMGKVLNRIEELLPDNLKHKVDEKGHPTFVDLDHEIAKVLAGQTITGKNGAPISIFDNRDRVFNEYREYYMDTTNTTPTDPGDTDPDFYNPQNGGSDLLLLGPNEIAKNFSHQSQGPWIEPNKALNLATQVLMRDEELGRKDPVIQASYRRDIKHKFEQYFGTNILSQQAGLNALAKYKTGAQVGMPDSINNKVILDEFVLRGMIDPATYKTIKEKEQNRTTESVI